MTKIAMKRAFAFSLLLKEIGILLIAVMLQFMLVFETAHVNVIPWKKPESMSQKDRRRRKISTVMFQ